MSQEALRNTVAEFFQVDPGSIRPDFVLGGQRLSNSLARGHLDSAIRRRVGTKLAAVHSAKIFAELEAELLGTPLAPAPAAAATSASVPTVTALPARNGTTGVRCGVDIELIDNLPKAADYWEHEFYRTHFTDAEIAYCLLQENPPIHFVARWCAKEAIKKCDPSLLKVEMTALEVAQGESGGMVLRHVVNGTANVLPHALSISHTRFSAVAVVVAVDFPQAQAVLPEPAAAPEPPPQPRAGKLGRIAVALSGAALVLAGLAFLRVFHLI